MKYESRNSPLGIICPNCTSTKYVLNFNHNYTHLKNMKDNNGELFASEKKVSKQANKHVSS